MNVLLMNEQGVTIVAVMLAKGLSMIAKDDKQRVCVQSAALQALEQLTQRSVSIVQRIAVASEFVCLGEGARLRGVVRMVSGDGQISDKKHLTARERINPGQHVLDGRRLVHAKTGVEVAADWPGVLQDLVTAILNHRLHAEIRKSA